MTTFSMLMVYINLFFNGQIRLIDYKKKSDDDGWTWVIVDGSDDGDYGSHDAEIRLIIGWEMG